MNNTSQTSYLNEFQKSGTAINGQIPLAAEQLDTAIMNLTKLSPRPEWALYKGKSEDDLPPTTLMYYCQDCRDMVSVEHKKVGKKLYKAFCSVCGGKKIAMGSENAIRDYYRR